MGDLWKLSAEQLTTLIRDRQVSAHDAAADALERVAAVNPTVNAMAEVRAGDVLDRARRIDELLADGRDPGILCGVPVAVKINVDQAGFATSNGTLLQRDLIADSNSPVVDNLLRAGAVPVGRSNGAAFSLRWFTTNRIHGATRNPHNPGITAGGSSGGSAAAVATGLCAIAHGTDIAGSIGYPAYACGVHGLRPGFGRVPAFNASVPERPIGPQLMAVSGPIARTVADLRLGLLAMAAGDPRDPWWTPAPLAGPGTQPLKIAVCPRPGGLPVAVPIERLLYRVAHTFSEAAVAVEMLEDLPFFREAGDIQERLWLGEGFEALRSAVEQDGDDGAVTMVRMFRSKAESITSLSVLQSLSRRTSIIRQLNALFMRYDAILLPVSAELPFDNDVDLVDDGSFWRVWNAQLVQRVLAVLGVPVLTLAAGFIDDVPVGFQIVTARFNEGTALRLGDLFEAIEGVRGPIDPTTASQQSSGSSAQADLSASAPHSGLRSAL